MRLVRSTLKGLLAGNLSGDFYDLFMVTHTHFEGPAPHSWRREDKGTKLRRRSFVHKCTLAASAHASGTGKCF